MRSASNASEIRCPRGVRERTQPMRPLMAPGSARGWSAAPYITRTPSVARLPRRAICRYGTPGAPRDGERADRDAFTAMSGSAEVMLFASVAATMCSQHWKDTAHASKQFILNRRPVPSLLCTPECPARYAPLGDVRQRDRLRSHVYDRSTPRIAIMLLHGCPGLTSPFL